MENAFLKTDGSTSSTVLQKPFEVLVSCLLSSHLSKDRRVI